MKTRTLLTIAAIILIIYFLSKAMSGTSNDRFIKKMSPDVQPLVKRFVTALEAAGYKPVIIDSTRSYQEQQQLKKSDPRNAAAGTSAHEAGKAFDMNVYDRDGKLMSKKTVKAIWLNQGIPQMAGSFGMKWGGDFKGYADNNHFYF